MNVLKIHTENLNLKKEKTQNSVKEVTDFAKGGN